MAPATAGAVFLGLGLRPRQIEGLLSAQSSSPKLYVPSQAQLRPPKYEITALAWSSLNFPVPPEMVITP